MVEDFWDAIFSCVTVEGRVVDSNMDGFSNFSGSLFTILVYHLEVRDVCSVVVVRTAVFVNHTGDMIIVFFSSIF